MRRFPASDGTVERELRRRLEELVLRRARPDDRSAGLVALLHRARLHRLACPGLPRKEVAPRIRRSPQGSGRVRVRRRRSGTCRRR
ncbi:GPP34 family phosphoprotein [Streptomyces calvus]|uniref:GPP34 family phosphoprotein n=1 Tax=Streptomyces calvus TaxID=67282 RepID=UPI001E50481F|nr:GPP34 family phosphoprotein [Streptomyces calvus]